MGTQPTVLTERLVLRPFEERDLDAYTALLAAEPVRRSLHLPDDVGREEAWRQMAMWRGQWELRGTGQWALEERASGVFVGRAGTHRPERADWPGVEVGWALHPDHWDRGFAAEAGAAVVDHAFSVEGRAELWSVILPENERSQRVARRLGFTLLRYQTLSFFPESPHGIWHLPVDRWRAEAGRAEAAAGATGDGPDQGGEAACLLDRLCPTCGAVLEGGRCWRCPHQTLT
jgi:ribosomal-protein-alanine N-acetyltransferase